MLLVWVIFSFLYGFLILHNLDAAEIGTVVLNISTVEEMQSKLTDFENKVTHLESEIFYLKTKGKYIYLEPEMISISDARSCSELKEVPGFEKSGVYFIGLHERWNPKISLYLLIFRSCKYWNANKR